MKKLIILFAFILLMTTPVSAATGIKTHSIMNNSYSCELPNRTLNFRLKSGFEYNGVYAPEGTEITATVIETKEAKRLKRDAYLTCSVDSVSINGVVTDVKDKDVHVVIKQFTPKDKKYYAKMGLDTAATTVASHFIPGGNIIYNFAQGAVVDSSNKNRVVSGVKNAYEKSFLSYFSKGDPINLKPNDEIITVFYDSNDH